jgi:hypothetical protein
VNKANLVASEQSLAVERKPPIAETPTISRSGALVWNVRDIVFGPNRSAEAGSPLGATPDESPEKK